MLWMFRPIDTWFFRGSSSFNAGEPANAHRSIFPPSMQTLQGAIRSALAQGQGWNPRQTHLWPEALGDPNSLGELQLSGPYLCRFSNNQYEYLFPPMATILYVTDAEDRVHFTRLEPGVEPVLCDLDPRQGIRLATPLEPYEGLKPLQEVWLTRKGWEKVLAGDIPASADIIKADALWTNETRVGIGLDSKRRTTITGQLYSTTHTRFVCKTLCLVVVVNGVPQSWHQQCPNIVTLGGEGRMAQIEIKTAPPHLLPEVPRLSPRNGKTRFTVSLVTPGVFNDETEEVVRFGPKSFGERCICACIGKMQRIGGWDIARGVPRPVRPVIPAGSTWFYESEEADINTILSWHGRKVGDMTEYGYGQVIIGKWGEKL